MARQAHNLFLEEWLRRNSGIGSDNTTSSSSSARAIIQAWSDLRESLQSQSFHHQHLQSLNTLLNSQASLYVADPQAKLLCSILSSTSISLPPESYPVFLRLLYIWVRKSSKPSPVLIDSSVTVLSHVLDTQFVHNKSFLFFSELVVLLGAISCLASVSGNSKTICLELLCRLLEQEYQLITSSEQLLSNVLAGLGYALSSSGNLHFVKILDSLFTIWNSMDRPSIRLSHGLMILHLTEWVVSSLVKSNSLERVNIFTKEILQTSKEHYASFAILMAAAGALRASSRTVTSPLQQLKASAKDKIEHIARGLISGTAGFSNPEKSLILNCMSLALARCGTVSFRGPVLTCLASALLSEIFSLEPLYTKILQSEDEDCLRSLHNEVKEHLNSAPFKEAGGITGVFCNQYVSADEVSRCMTENMIWDYCQSVYLGHRRVSLMLRGRDDELLGDLEKIAESAFLMVVVFALTVTKYKLHPSVHEKTQMEVSVKILISFSCMEYFRRMRLPEYMDAIKTVVVAIQEHVSACALFVESVPPYSDLTNHAGWWKDEVQTSRILFHLRVIPTCVECLPVPVFQKVVAPVMFLYMGHPNVKVARASHSMFVAFVSSGKDCDEDERVELKEKLVFYYIQRSLGGYPEITPFEGLASGVAGLVRYLPAGSPSIFYTVYSLVEKARDLCGEVSTQETALWRTWQEELEPCKKIVDLLSRLLSLVDVQVLPSLMKQLAQLIAIFPREGQNTILGELYAQVAESDDVTRKPSLVSWLQSLSYLCSKHSKGEVHRDKAALLNNEADLANTSNLSARL